jgi:hypothetical protein
MIIKTLENIYPSFFEVFVIFLILISSFVFQGSISNALLVKYQTEKVFTLYYLTNLALGSIAAAIFLNEELTTLILADFGLILVSTFMIIFNSDHNLEYMEANS